MKAQINSGLLAGVDGCEVTVNVEKSKKQKWVGWAPRAGEECSVRVESAIARSSINRYPTRVIAQHAWYPDYLVHSPALDLAVAVGILVAGDVVSPAHVKDSWFFGELSLSGRLLPIRGALPLVLEARRRGVKSVVLPESNAKEVLPWVNNVEILQAENLGEVLGWFLYGKSPRPVPVVERKTVEVEREVLGSPNLRRALTIAAAGGHNILLIGPPGSGKTLAARSLFDMLPPLRFDEHRVVASIYSAAGLGTDPRQEYRGFRAPHHTISYAGLVGGGKDLPRPGEVSLAHCGVLFLDDLTEFSEGVIDSLHDTVKRGYSSITNSNGLFEMPASLQLVAAANPCPCGHLGDPRRACSCTAKAIERYRARLAKLAKGLFDITANVPPLPIDAPTVSLSLMSRNVRIARERQVWRCLSGSGSECNAWSSALDIEVLRNLRPEDDRVLKVARTIADLDDWEIIREQHIDEAKVLVGKEES